MRSEARSEKSELGQARRKVVLRVFFMVGKSDPGAPRVGPQRLGAARCFIRLPRPRPGRILRAFFFPQPLFSSVSTPPEAGPALPTPPHTPTAKAPILHSSHNAFHFICNPPGFQLPDSWGGRHVGRLGCREGAAGVGAPRLAAWKQWERRQWPDSAQECLANCAPQHKRPKQMRKPRPPGADPGSLAREA